MAAELKVPDAAVEAAAQAISKRHLSNTGVPFPISACRDDARAALEAGLAAMLEPMFLRIDGMQEYRPKPQRHPHASKGMIAFMAKKPPACEGDEYGYVNLGDVLSIVNDYRIKP